MVPAPLTVWEFNDEAHGFETLVRGMGRPLN